MKGNKIVLKAAGGINFRLKQKKDGVIVIEAFNKIDENASGYDYKNPVIPQGFEYLKGEWNNGFTIRNKSDGSEFVWIPIGWVEPDGTMDGETFDERFGRRSFKGEEFSKKQYSEEVKDEMLDSIKKYHGLYISAYLASKENGKLVFKKGNEPWVNVNLYEAKSEAKHYSDGNLEISTYLPYGAVYDTIFKWLIQVGEKTYSDIADESTFWGNYDNTPDSPKKVMPTGSNEEWCACNIYDLAGNCDEWSMEQKNGSSFVTRGGAFYFRGRGWPVADRFASGAGNTTDYTSFRCVLYLK